MQIVTVQISTLKNDDRNARKHGERNIAETMRSLQEFGQHAPIVVQRSTNKVLVGNGRLEAMRRLGWTDAAVFYVDDNNDTAVRRALADNRTAELAEWDDDVLRNIIKEYQGDASLDAIIGFNDDDFKRILTVKGDAVDDEYDIVVPVNPTSKAGDVWILGRHRVMCGDSTTEAAMARLMAGAQAQLILTDPPYNVNYGEKVSFLNEHKDGVHHREKSYIENDNMEDGAFYNFLLAAFTRLKECAAVGAGIYVFHSDQEGINFRMAMRAAGWNQHQVLIWAKQTFIMGRSDYHWQHEPILYGWNEGPHYFCGDRTQGTVIDDARPEDIRKMKKPDLIAYAEALQKALHGDETTVLRERKPARSDDHPTMKPVTLCGRLINNSSRVDNIVVDSFGGSGSTLIAAEQLDRRCYMMELDPRYCDVIVDRWEKFTGLKATLEVQP